MYLYNIGSGRVLWTEAGAQIDLFMEINNLPKSKQAFLLTKCVEFSNYIDANRGRWKQVHSIGCVLKPTAFAWDELRYEQNPKLRNIINHFRYLTRSQAVSFTVENFSYKGVLKSGSLKKTFRS